MSDIMLVVLELFEFWIQTHWYIALSMSFVTNFFVYLVTALCIDFMTKQITNKNVLGQFIDVQPLKKNQKLREAQYGALACVVFALVSLLTRDLFVGIMPGSITQLLFEAIVFTVFYETYSYFIHRILHLPGFRTFHSVHHYSVRTTPWGAYGVHPVEAFFISASAPLFMLLFPVHLSVIFGFHIFGVIFTMLLHSNVRLNEGIIFARFFNRYTACHSAHHSIGNVSFGFVNSFWDKTLKTDYMGQEVERDINE